MDCLSSQLLSQLPTSVLPPSTSPALCFFLRARSFLSSDVLSPTRSCLCRHINLAFAKCSACVSVSVCLTWAPKYVHMSVCPSVCESIFTSVCPVWLVCLVRLVCSSLSARIFNDFLTFSFSLDIFCCQPLCWQTFFLSYTLSWPLLKYELITIWLQAESQTQAHTYPHTDTHAHAHTEISTHFLGFCCLVVSFWYVELAFVRSMHKFGSSTAASANFRCLFIALWVSLARSAKYSARPSICLHSGRCSLHFRLYAFKFVMAFGVFLLLPNRRTWLYD